MRTLSHDEIVLLVTSSFTFERIEAAKKALFEVSPDTSQHCITYKGQQKDSNHVKLCMRVLNECGEDVPRFVSHFLDDLPPVSFNHIDVSKLLGRMEQLNSEICCMKRTLETQTNVCENLREVTAAIDGWLTAGAAAPPSNGTRGCCTDSRCNESEGDHSSNTNCPEGDHSLNTNRGGSAIGSNTIPCLDHGSEERRLY